MEYYLTALRKYADFSGRARRREFWYFQLFSLIAAVLLEIIAVLGRGTGGSIPPLSALPFGLYSLATFLPSLAVTVRRLHDIDKSGWWFFIGLVPFIGGIWLLILECQDGTPGPNRYGPDSKNVDSGVSVTA